MKKTNLKALMATMLVCIMTVSGIMFVQADEQMPVTVFVNGEQIEFDVNPIIENGRTLVPVRYIFEALDATVDWIEETSTVVATKGDIEITLAIGSTEMTKNGEIIILDVPAKEIDGRTLVPARAVSEGMDAKVEWIDELQQVIITTEAAEEITPEPVGKDEYNHTELSLSDAETLKACYEDVRYDFEQIGLPDVLFGSPAQVAEDIENKNNYTIETIKDVWNSYFVSLAVQIQVESEDTYIFDGSESLTEDALYNEYIKLVTNLNMSADNYFDVTFEETEGGKKIALVTFKNTDTMLACKYIAIVPVNDGIRYLTAESDPFLEDGYMLCEVTEEYRGSITVISTEKADFLAGIDNVIDNNLIPTTTSTIN